MLAVTPLASFITYDVTRANGSGLVEEGIFPSLSPFDFIMPNVMKGDQ